MAVEGSTDIGYNQSYTQIMKTAISLPNEVFAAAEELASRLGISRSELYATAVADYVRAMREQGVLACLNDVYPAQPSDLDAGVAEAQFAAIESEDW
jgi:metal-responsive CopG/Arc/MetJ family transcriptional regulator